MRNRFPEQARAIFVCLSDHELHTICDTIQQHYELPAFQYDEHNTWEYGASMGGDIGFNITKTQQLDTIRRWMPDVAQDLNYQIILFVNPTQNAQPTYAATTDTGSIGRVHTHLVNVFGVPVRHVGPAQRYSAIQQGIKQLLRGKD